MRHLLPIDIPATLRRNKPVEQFLGRSPVDPTYIRHIELRPANDSIELWIHDVEDLGSEGYSDLYDFPHFEPDEQHAPAAVVPDAAAAVAYARTRLAADPDRWTNVGIAESDYLDYIRAGRPSCWPVVS
ncbi:hypothetical protein [Xanthomonas cannabis]|uniref:Integron gene cassette protein n=1 Tax=Xanthomonas cannabis TaxID=1885674 RepID=A0ABR6JST8_9XANT|nr:hypothetical protein [Xanthomonas cannabis]MBB4595366.1 hypothetical protein [Xanthomonas cannabis]MBB5524190.1 hypothetical protein [Xanthomonas cannabis]